MLSTEAEQLSESLFLNNVATRADPEKTVGAAAGSKTCTFNTSDRAKPAADNRVEQHWHGRSQSVVQDNLAERWQSESSRQETPTTPRYP